MPLKLAPMTRKEIIIAREDASATVEKVIHLLLRSGARGFLEFQREIVRVSEGDRVSSSSGHRLNIEALKAVFRSCGVLLEAEEYRRLMLGYSDAVGFLLVDALLSAICPASHVSASAERDLLAAFPAAAPPKGSGSINKNASSDGDEQQEALELPDVTLDSALGLLAFLFAPTGDAAADVETAQNNTNARLQAAYEESAEDFTLEAYPDARVPGLGVVNYIAALLMLYAADRGFTAAVTERLRSAGRPALEACPPRPSAPALARSAGSSKQQQPQAYTMVHTGVRSTREFERYTDADRRDEWLRGSNEPASRPGYLRHTVGYGGHLPEYQYHFGRTFHVIEEDLPLLTKPAKPLEPVAPDAFGPGRETRAGIMNEHHFKFA